MVIFFAAVVSLVCIIAGEYVIHRWVLHGRWLGNNRWRREHLLHHKLGDGDFSFGPSLPAGLAVSAPVSVVMLACFGWWGWFVFIWMTGGYLLYTQALHKAMHRKHLLRSVWGFGRVMENHRWHHADPKKHFAVTFPMVIKR